MPFVESHPAARRVLVALLSLAGVATATLPLQAQVPRAAAPPPLRAFPLPSRAEVVARSVALAPDLTGNVIKTVTDVNGGNVVPGDTLEYVITTTNGGTTDATLVAMVDVIPTNTTYAAGSLVILSGPNAGAKSDAINDDQAQFEAGPPQRVRFRLGTGASSTTPGTLAAGQSTSIRFRVVVNGGVPVGTVISNTGRVNYTDPLTGVDRTQNSLPPGGPVTGQPTTITLTEPDVTIAKSHSGSFRRGQLESYTISVSNVGSGVTTGTTTVSDVVPAGLTPTSATGTGWSCGISGQTVTCTSATSVAAGGSFPPITLAVDVAASAPSSVTNIATVSGGGESNASNNSAADPTSIIDPPVDVVIAKSATPPAFTVGSNATYTLDVSNSSAFNTVGTITVTDVLPAGLTFVSAGGTGWSCANASGTVTCTHPGPIAAGGALPGISLVVSVGSAAAPSVTNTASVAATGEVDPSDNSASVTTPVGSAPSIDLSIAKSHSGNFVVGSTHSFTLTVTNVGSAATSGAITVHDTLPGTLAFNSATGTGWSCTNSSGRVQCTNAGPLAAGVSTTITLTVNVNPGAYPGVTNRAHVVTAGDANAANNSATDPVTVETIDLAIAKVAATSFVVGSNASYTLTVSNLSPTASNRPITVLDTLPAGLTFVSAAGTGWSCSHTSGVVSCTPSAPIAGGTSAPPVTLTVAVGSAAAPSVTNRAWVRIISDLITANNGASVTTPVATPAPDLSIAKTASGTFTVGSNASYTLAVANVGTAATTGAITVTDLLPAGLTYVSATGSGWSCSESAGTVTCTHPGPVSGGASLADITLTVAVGSAAAPTVSNTASVTTAGDGNAGNNSSTANTPVSTPAVADLAMAKTASTVFTVGSPASYSLVVSNVSASASSGTVTVTDTLPTGLTFVSATGTGWSCGATANIVSCTTSAAVAGGAAFPAIALTVNVGSAALPSVTNRAHVALTGDPNGANDSATAVTPVSTTPVVDLSIAKSHGAPFVAGANGTYTLDVRNVGTAATSAPITVTDPLPAGLTYVSATGAGWSCAATAGTVTCTNAGPLAAGATTTITLTVAVGAGALPGVTNTATVATSGDANAANNSASDPTAVVSIPDLAMAKSALTSLVVGMQGQYQLDVSNVSSGATTGIITVTDVLPTGLTFVSAAGGGFSCTAAGQTVSCTRSSALPAGQAASIVLTVQVGASAAPGVTNSASVSTPGDLNAANNVASVTSAVGTGVDLAIAKTASTLVSGSQGTFTLTVSNVGTGSTSGAITATDLLPAGVTFVGASGSGFTCGASGQLVTCTRTTPLAAGASVSITLTVSVTAAAGTGLSNTASTSAAGDVNLSNNSATVGPLSVVAPTPDLSIAKRVTGVIVAGGSATFAIDAQNVGGGATTGAITVVDTLQSGLTFVSASGGGWSCSATGQVVTCTYAAPLAAGATTTISIVTSVASGVTLVANSASGGTPGDTNPANNSASTGPVPVGAAPDLSMVKAAAGPFTVGQSASYTLTVTNIGAGPTVGPVTITDVLPASLQFVSAGGAGWTCSASGQVVSCTNPGPLAPGSSSQVTLTVLPRTTAAPSVTNTATVVTPSDANGGNNSGSATTPVSGTVDLALAKAGSDSLEVGTTTNYTITVRNVGTIATTSPIVVTDTLPTGITYVSGVGGGFACSVNAGVVTCTRTLALAPSEVVVLTLTATVTSGVLPPVSNRACVATSGDSNTANDCGSTTAGIGGTVDLVLSKDVVGKLVGGQAGRFSLAVRNVGTAPAEPTITVVDTLSAGLTFGSASGNGWMCAAAGQVVTCLRSSALAPGATSTIDLTVGVQASIVPTVTNCARVTGANETASRVNNVSCVTVATEGRGSLAIEKRVSRDEAQVGDALDYTIVVRNTGSFVLPDVVVTDDLPAGFRFEGGTARIDNRSMSDPSGAPGPRLSFAVGQLPVGAVATLRYRVRITPGVRAGTSTNIASAASSRGNAVSQPARASTRIVGGLFEERGAIVGKVYTQCNCASALQEAGEVGIPGVRVTLEDGSSAVTDVEGKYSFYNVSSRLHVVKVDRATLPAGVVLTPLGNRNAGDGYSRFADVKAGELHKADFADGSGAPEVLQRVLERRRGGEVTHAGERAVPSTYPASEPVAARPVTGRDSLRGEARVAHDLANERGTVGTTMLAAPPLHPRGPSGGETQGYSPLLGTRTLNDRNSQLPVTPLAARDRRGSAPQGSGRLEVTVTPHGIPADGQTLVPVYVRLLDAAGEPVKGTVAATLETSLGRWVNASALDVANQGLQVTLSDGQGAFYLAAPGEPGRGELRVTTDHGEATLPLSFVPSARQLTAVGLLNARVDLRALLSGGNALGSDDDGFEEALRDWSTTRDSGRVRAGARGALFLKGRVAGDRLLTLAYDSERDRGRTYFRDIRPDEFFPTYGDGGLREFDGQSRRRFYARLDDGTSYTQFGDFQTARADERRILGAYDRTLNGALQHFEGSRGQATLFASQGRSRQVVDELPGRGISGPYALSRAEGLVNSERVEIIVRDRNQPSVILSRRVLTRFADYTIEALTGRLVMRAPVPSADANLNPVSIRVTYEAETPQGDTYWVYGADASWRVATGLEVGGTFARDENPLYTGKLAAVNATAKLAAGTFVLGEWARTSQGSMDGNAARVELRHQSDRIEGRAFVTASDSGFQNSSSTFTGGRTEFGGRFSARLDDRTRLVGEALHTEDNVRDGRRDGVLLAFERQLTAAWRAEFGYRYAKEDGAQSPNQSALVPVDRDVSALRGRLTWTLPRQTRSALFAEFEQDVRDASYRGALGGEYILSNRARLYGRHEWLTSFEGPYAINGGLSQQYTVFGIDADYFQNARMFSEYRARDAFNGRDAEASIGVRNRWALAPGLVVNTSFERVAPLFAGSPVNTLGTQGDALAVTGGVEWTRPSLWKSTARLEYRDAEAGDNFLASLGYARKLSRDWTLLGRTLWDVAEQGQNQTRGWSQLGLAWRETDRNRWNAVMRYENRVQYLGATAASGSAESVAHILAALVNHQPSQRLTLSGRYAARQSNDALGTFETKSTAQLFMGRGLLDLTSRVDAGLIGSMLVSEGFASRRYGLGGELGLLVMRNLRIAGGYNLFGFTDKDLNTFGTTRKGAYLELGFKFDESLFGMGGTAAPCEQACKTGGKDE
jgi:uncharacterized repeat protein (TIGR01451 family)